MGNASQIQEISPIVLMQKQDTGNGAYHFTFTAQSSETRFRLVRRDEDGSGQQNIYLDHIALYEIRDTSYNDTTFLATSNGYRYGFNGMLKDDEWNGVGSSYSTFFRQYDSRLGRWLSLDPKKHKYPNMSPFTSFANSPLIFIDLKGDILKFVGEKENWQKFKSIIEAEYGGNLKLTRDANNEVHASWIDPKKIGDKILNDKIAIESRKKALRNSKAKFNASLVSKAIKHQETTVLEDKGDEEVFLFGRFRGNRLSIKEHWVDMSDIEALDKAKNVTAYGMLIHELYEAYNDQAVNGSPEEQGSTNKEKIAYRKEKIFKPLHDVALQIQAKADGNDKQFNYYFSDTDLFMLLSGKKNANGKMKWTATIFQVSKDRNPVGNPKTYTADVVINKNGDPQVSNLKEKKN